MRGVALCFLLSLCSLGVVFFDNPFSGSAIMTLHSDPSPAAPSPSNKSSWGPPSAQSLTELRALHRLPLTLHVNWVGYFLKMNTRMIATYQFMFSDIGRPLVIAAYNPKADINNHSIIMNIQHNMRQVIQHVRKMGKDDLRVALWHQRDEINNHDHPYDATQHPFAFIFRDYYHPTYNGSRVKSAPLGSVSCGTTVLPRHFPLGVFYTPHHQYEYPVQETRLPMASRPIDCWWKGSIRAQRAVMVKYFRSLSGEDAKLCKVEVVRKFQGNPDDRGDYMIKMANAKFVLNPAGSSPENIRWGEAVATGTIPVTIDVSPFCADLKTFNNGVRAPGVYARDWPDAIAQMKTLLADPLALAELHESWIVFGSRLQRCMKQDLKLLVDTLIGD